MKRLLSCFLLVLSVALAQVVDPNADLGDIVIEGLSDPGGSLERLVRVTMVSRPGVPVSAIDLGAERNRILNMGTFASVSLSLEQRNDVATLLVRVVENPRIADIQIVGISEFFSGNVISEAELVAQLGQVNILERGAVLHNIRSQEAKETIQAIYRQAVALPFDIPVELTLEAVTNLEGVEEVVLTYRVDEAVSLRAVEVEGSTVLESSQLEGIVRPLSAAESFEILTYISVVQAVAAAYTELGYRQSGIDPEASDLTGDVLTLRFRELTIASIDTTALGINPDEVSLQPGDLFNYDQLLSDVKALAEGRDSDIRLETLVTRGGEVLVTFQVGAPETAGPIDRIAIEGNTVFSDEQLIALLTLQQGDTFSSQLANEDFVSIRSFYQEQGYFLVNQPDFIYLEDGTYLQRVREVRITGYELLYEADERKTQEHVITRYLPNVGSIYNRNEVREGLLKIARLSVVQPLAEAPTIPDPLSPEAAIIQISLREQATGLFQPGIQYATDTGFSAAVTYSESNFLGEAHDISIDFNGQNADLGQVNLFGAKLQFGGGLTYSIPWLFIPFADFESVPTSISASLFSVFSTDQALTAAGRTKIDHPCIAEGLCEDSEANEVFVGQYFERDSGLSLSIGRPILENTSLRLSGRVNYASYTLEPNTKECSFDDAGQIEDNSCFLDQEVVEANNYLPQEGLSSFISTSVNFDNRDSFEFPREGVAATTRLGVGFGSDYRDPTTLEQTNYVYQQVEFGVKSYLLLKDLFPDLNDQHVVAGRLNVGHQFGNDYPSSKFFRVGSSTNEATQIRGYRSEDVGSSQTYVTTSMEYRYDFGLSTVATQTVIGIVFADLGFASNIPEFDLYEGPLKPSLGLGMQLNLGFSGIALPPIRFDYGFSLDNPQGVFGFRLGAVF